MLDVTLYFTMLYSYLYPFRMTARQADQDFVLLILLFCAGRSFTEIEHAERADHLGFFATHDIWQCRVLDDAGDDMYDLAVSGMHCAQRASDSIDRDR